MENRGMRVNMNKTKVMISGEHQKLMQKDTRWPCGVIIIIIIIILFAKITHT